MAAYRGAGNPQIGWVPPHPLTPTDEDRREGAAQVATEQSALIGAAVTWAVTADMVALVNHAAATMPGETVERFEIPTANGFVYLETPAYSETDAPPGEHGLKVPHRAFHWYEIPGGLNVICYKGRADFVEGELPPSPDDISRLPRLRSDIEFDFRFGSEDWATSSVGRWLKALWTISGQRIAAVSEIRPDRAAMRRAQRAGLRSDSDSAVRVVSLRRPEHVPHGQTEPSSQWSHRWIVSGHWRNQWLPSVGQHRLQWIDDHVKGPADKPLVLKQTVMNVHR